MRTEAVINAKEKRQQKQLRKKGVQDLHSLFALSEDTERKKRLCYCERYLRLFVLAENTKAVKARKIYAEKI